LSADLTEDLLDLYETAPCGYISLLPDARVAKVNRTLADWLGRNPEELIGKSIHDLLSFGGRIAFETHLAPLMRMQGHVNEIALDMLAADGAKIPMIGNAAEKRGPGAEHLFTRLTLFRAVDRRAYERGLVEARVKAEAEYKAEREAALLREQFIAVLGHDLRNPLAALAAGIRMLEEREQLTDRGKLIITEMRGSTERAMTLIDDVLDFARGRLGGGISIDRRPVELEPVLSQVVAEIRSIASNHTIDSRFDLDVPVSCDAGRLAQLLANLLSNAVTHGAEDQPVTVEATTSATQLVISVANAGERIPDAVREQLFRPFFRGASRPSRNGLGLGLFIANEIAKAHDGSIDVSSTDEQTRFTFTMPLLEEQKPD
jgi:phosphoserine phosphatase RsbU/P